MKKTLIALMVLVAVILPPLSAEVKAIVTIKPYFTGSTVPNPNFNYNGSDRYVWGDARDVDTWNDLDNDWWMTRQDYWLNAYRKTSFADFGISASYSGFNFVTRIDIAQDFLANLQNPEGAKTNIPFVGGLIDLTFPRLGFIDYTSENGSVFVSAGRRLIKWGPGTYDIAISDSQPYLDNIWAEFNAPVSDNWKFTYNWVGVYPKVWMNYNTSTDNKDVQKVIFGHRWSFGSNFMRISISELNNVYNKIPTFFEASPFAIWHDNNQDDYSNVFLHLTLEGKIAGARIWGSFSMDDFELPHEVGGGKPQANGFALGAEYHVFDGKSIGDSKFDTHDYTLREESLKVENGLNVGAEWYYTTPLMYNRVCDEGKFMIPFQFISLAGQCYVYDENAFFLGFKYGPNTSLLRFYAEYTDDPIEASLSAELITRGRYNINSTYGDRAKLNAMGLGNMVSMMGDQTKALVITGNIAYYLQPALKGTVGFNYQLDMTHKKSAYQLNIGVCINPCEVDWNNLF